MEKLNIIQIGICHEHAAGKFESLKKRPDLFNLIGYVDEAVSAVRHPGAKRLVERVAESWYAYLGRKPKPSGSAAAEGVGALRSAAKSVKEKSISWPTADITGSPQSWTAATTISSLKAHKSSNDPPPRPTISTSQRFSSSA